MVTDDMPQLNAEATEVNDDCLSVTDDSRSFNDEVWKLNVQVLHRSVEDQSVTPEPHGIVGDMLRHRREIYESAN